MVRLVQISCLRRLINTWFLAYYRADLKTEYDDQKTTFSCFMSIRWTCNKRSQATVKWVSNDLYTWSADVGKWVAIFVCDFIDFLQIYTESVLKPFAGGFLTKWIGEHQWLLLGMMVLTISTTSSFMGPRVNHRIGNCFYWSMQYYL